ncbi:hypothetical protein HHK36_007839 [Tetracentron sinense]|uniref:Calponin-homology (CH) domain-containing protein n=1 Tax=Tetracentron sinense TaxID=13715 RepID=A0A834ZFD7_TETSI|nr:hypothetical protein HHK36_007839 [Tetracentron sinense]
MGRAVPRIDSPDALRISTDSSPSSAESSFRELDDVFLQTQTRIWLGEVLHTRLDEETNIADLLADGELLFQVSKVVWKMLLTKCMELRHSKGYIYEPIASRKSRGRYTPYSNIDSFFKICKILGLTSIDLFSPSDVVEKRDIRRVCMCIRSLSKKGRSKHLNVPDFDVVTYTIAMPTDMVGCIRRSLELSQYRFSSPTSYSPCKDSRVKYSQRNWVAEYAGHQDFYSEESDDVESNYMEVGLQSPSTSTSYDTESQMISNLNNSPGGSSVVDESSSLAGSVFQLDIQDHEKDGHSLSIFKSPFLAESMGSLHAHRMKNDDHPFTSAQPESTSTSSCFESKLDLNEKASCTNGGGIRRTHENGAMGSLYVGLDLRTRAPIVGDTMDGNTTGRNYIDRQLSISDLIGHRTDNSDPVLLDGEDRIFRTGSNSRNRTLEYEFERRSTNEIEYAELSSTASLNSISGKVVTVDYEDQFDVHDEFSTVKVQFPELHNLEGDHVDKSSMRGYESQDIVECEVLVDSLTMDTDRQQFDMKLEDIGSSAKLFLPSSDWQPLFMGVQNHVLPHNNRINMFHINSDVAQANGGKLLSNCSDYLYSKDVLRNVHWYQLDGFLSDRHDSLSGIQTCSEKHECSMVMLSCGSDGYGTSPDSALPHGMHLNFALHSPTKTSGETLWLKDANSIVADNVKEIFSATINESDVDAKENLNNYPQTASFSNSIENTFKDLNAALDTVAFEESENFRSCSTAGDGGLQQHKIMDISYCSEIETHHTAGYSEVGVEGEVKVLVGLECSEHVFAEDNLNCFLKETYEEDVGLNKFSTVLTGTDGEDVGYISVQQVNPSGTNSGVINKESLFNVQSTSNGHEILCRKNSSLADISDQDQTTNQVNLDVPKDKPITPTSGVVQSAESDNLMGQPERQRLETGGMVSPIDLSDLEGRDMGGQDIHTPDMVAVKDPVGHQNGVVLGSQCVPAPENRPWLTVAHSENIGKDHINQHPVDENDLQVNPRVCTDHNESRTGNMNKEISKHENNNVDARAVESSEGKEDNRSVRPPECNSRKKSLLKSVAGGMTVFGALFLLHHLRRSGREKISESSAPPTQNGKKANSGEASTQKGGQRGRVNGIYPAEKLRFDV